MTAIVVSEYRLQEIESRIHQRLKRIADDVIGLGQDFLEARELLENGEWGTWVDQFGLNVRTVQRYMQVARRFEAGDIMSRLKPTALIALAAPSCPGAAVLEVERRLEDGEPISPALVDEIITKYRTLEAVNAGAKVLLKDYGTDEHGNPTRSISRSAVTSLAAVTDDALERAVVEAGDIDIPVSDHVPASVRAAVVLETTRRKQGHVEDNTQPETRLEAAAVVTMVDAEAGVIVFRVPEIARRLKAGAHVGLIVRVKV